MPCFKLGIRFERPDLVKRFLQSKRTGFYLAVQREGEVTAGDPIEFIERSKSGVTIVDITNLYALDSQSQELLRRATSCPPSRRAGRITSANGSGTPTLDREANE